MRLRVVPQARGHGDGLQRLNPLYRIKRAPSLHPLAGSLAARTTGATSAPTDRGRRLACRRARGSAARPSAVMLAPIAAIHVSHMKARRIVQATNCQRHLITVLGVRRRHRCLLQSFLLSFALDRYYGATACCWTPETAAPTPRSSRRASSSGTLVSCMLPAVHHSSFAEAAQEVCLAAAGGEAVRAQRLPELRHLHARHLSLGRERRRSRRRSN